MSSTRRPAAREEHYLGDLLLWRYDVPDAKHATLPPSTSRPNPLVVGDLVVASVFSPGQIVAIERATGAPRWSFATGKFSGSAVYEAGGVLYAESSNTLSALDPLSGQLMWSFQPYPKSAESIYSQPVVDGERLFIGDRRGVLHCLNAQTGEVMWQTQTDPESEHKPNVNATALVYGGLVLTANNAGQCVAIDKASGEIVWRRQALDGASSNEVQLFRGRVLVHTRHSLFGLDPESGQQAWRETWRGPQIQAMAVAGTGTDALMVVSTRKPPTEEESSTMSVPEEEASRSELIGLDNERTHWVRRGAHYASAMRWDASTGLIYESRIDGFGIIEPRTGERICNIVAEEGDYHTLSQPSLAEVRDNTIYLLGGRGAMLALHHP
jgi:outer membrane protein assembly factor BamB